jgi:hypothetical protein
MTVVRGASCAIILTAALSLSGCGPSAKPTSDTASAASPMAAVNRIAATAPNACDVLDAAIAKKYLGDGVQLRRKAQLNPQMTQCQYGSDKGVITVMVGPWSMIHTGNPQDKPAPGLGDEAYNGPAGLDVRKGDLGVNIGVMVMSGEFWGKAADDALDQMTAAEAKVAPDLVARL